MGRSLLSSPFFVSTSAAFLFWFLLWFACILAFSFELRVEVASLELTFGCFDCFVRRLFPLFCLPFAVVYFFLPRLKLPNKLIYHLANQSFPIGRTFQEKTISFVYKISLVDETHLHLGRHYFLTALIKLKFADLSGNQLPINASV